MPKPTNPSTDRAAHDQARGGAFLSQGRFTEAEACYRAALAARPDDAEAHANLGFALHKQGRDADAVESYRRALTLDPASAVAHYSLGTILKRQGDLDAAIRHFDAALAQRPDYLAALNNLGNCLRRTGRVAEARVAFERALALDPALLEAHYNLAPLKTYQAGDPQIAHLAALGPRVGAMPELSRIRYGFTLGKMMEDTGRFDEAFAAYAEGNRLMKARAGWDEAAAADTHGRMLRVFDHAFFDARKPECAEESPIPIFIVGMPRSGTSLIEQILATCPGVHGAGELPYLHEALASLAGDLPPGGHRFPESLAALSIQDFRRLGDRYLARIRELAPGATHVTDKMPANAAYAGLIPLMLPGAKIIHAMRDPMDACFSCFSHHFRESNLAFTYDLEMLGHHWVRYHALMRHWHAVLPEGRILDVAYEAMVADMEGQARRLLDHLELPWDPRCLAFHENRRAVRTASAAQVQRPIYRSSVARWKPFEAHLGPLMALVKDYR